MSDIARLEIDGNSYEFPVIKGTENEVAIDIKKLRGATNGVITIDPGFKNTGSCESAITFLDGEKGILRYRGYSIEELAEKADFLEVAYALIFGNLPTEEQLEKFHSDIKSKSVVDDDVKKIIDAFPKTAHPMGILSSLTSALTAFNPSSVNVNSEEDMYNAIVKIMGKFPVLVAWTMRKKQGLPLNYGSKSLGYVENIMKMMFEQPNEEYVMNPIVKDALDKLLILHADHEQNCSTSTVRIVGSSHAGLFASLAAGISALWGPLHGGANQAVLEMLEAIKEDGGDTKKYMAKAKDKNDPFRLMGFGHRVYKNFDPRAKIIKKAADEVLADLGVNDPILEIAKGLEQEALNDPYFVERKLYPNVDFYSGIIYRALDIPVETLKAVLLFHVLDTEVASTSLSDTYVKTLSLGPNNEPLSLQVEVTGGVVFNGDAEPIQTDVDASNGIVHVIDKVMLPPNVVTLALNNNGFTSLVSALTRSDLTTDFVSILSGNGPFTVFAPTNAAFQALLDSNSSWNSLNDIPLATLEAVLKYHVISGANVQADQLSNGSVATLGGDLTINLTNGAQIETSSNQTVNILVGAATNDVQGTNGVIHAIDDVLIP